MRDYIENADFEETGFSYTLSLISGKYKMIILYCLMEYQPVRFNELQRYLGKISDKTLSQNLKELEKDELIHREAYPQIPPKVELFSDRAWKISDGGFGPALYLGNGESKIKYCGENENLRFLISSQFLQYVIKYN